MSRILTIAGTEFRIARRNRWITVSAVLMMIFALVLTAAGSAPSGALAADRLHLDGKPALALPVDAYEERLRMAREAVKTDSKRVAQVVKGWVSND